MDPSRKFWSTEPTCQSHVSTMPKHSNIEMQYHSQSDFRVAQSIVIFAVKHRNKLSQQAVATSITTSIAASCRHSLDCPPTHAVEVQAWPRREAVRQACRSRQAPPQVFTPLSGGRPGVSPPVVRGHVYVQPPAMRIATHDTEAQSVSSLTALMHTITCMLVVLAANMCLQRLQHKRAGNM